jgi:small conductance mechanosensitive channel
MAIELNGVAVDQTVNSWQQYFNTQIVPTIQQYEGKIIMIAALLIGGFIGIKIINHAVAKFFDKVDFDRGVEIFIENTVSVLLWVVFGMVLLANLGVDVTGVIAGLGIAGFVLGFALKDTLSNLASGVFILFNKPFKLHDYINVAGVEGKVTMIGMAACTLVTPDNKKVMIPNSAVWGLSAITNFTGHKERMLEIKVGISYDSKIDKVFKVVEEILKKDKRILKEPKHLIGIKEFGDSSINLVIRPWTTPEDYWPVYFDTIKKIKEEFDKHKIEIPYPQSVVHIKK